MRTILATALILAALTSAALADGAVELTDTQLDQVTAGNRLRVDVTVPNGGGNAMYFTPRIGGARVANPGVNVSFVPLDQMDWVSARFFAGSADDPFFFDIPGVIR